MFCNIQFIDLITARTERLCFVSVCLSVFVFEYHYSMLGPVSAWMGDRLRVGKLPVYNQPPRSTQPGHPSVGRRNEYQLRLGR